MDSRGIGRWKRNELLYQRCDRYVKKRKADMRTPSFAFTRSEILPKRGERGGGGNFFFVFYPLPSFSEVHTRQEPDAIFFSPPSNFNSRCCYFFPPFLFVVRARRSCASDFLSFRFILESRADVPDHVGTFRDQLSSVVVGDFLSSSTYIVRERGKHGAVACSGAAKEPRRS